MAEPGDPKGPLRPPQERDSGGRIDDAEAHDAQIGFVSLDSLIGRLRAPLTQGPAPVPATPVEESEPDLFDPPEPGPFDLSGVTTTPVARFETDRRGAPPHAAVREALAQQERTPARAPAGTAVSAPMSLYAVYVLILLAVPTLGVAALVGLFAVTGREGPREPLAASHFVYQQRTLWGAAIGAVLGALLVIVNIGVLVLFFLAIWVLARGAFGVLRLKSGQAVPRPRGWLF